MMTENVEQTESSERTATELDGTEAFYAAFDRVDKVQLADGAREATIRLKVGSPVIVSALGGCDIDAVVVGLSHAGPYVRSRFGKVFGVTWDRTSINLGYYFQVDEALQNGPVRMVGDE